LRFFALNVGIIDAVRNYVYCDGEQEFLQPGQPSCRHVSIPFHSDTARYLICLQGVLSIRRAINHWKHRVWLVFYYEALVF
jgi:hypothetical protein